MKSILSPQRKALPALLITTFLIAILQSTSRGAESRPVPKFNVDATPIARDAAHVENSYSSVVKKTVPSVVNIYSTRTVKLRQNWFNMPDDMFHQFFGDRQGRQPRTFEEQGLGSGVVVSADGYILTANHVVDGADPNGVKVAIDENGKEYSAKVVGTDPGTDVAVLKIEAKDLPAITIADSSQLEVGDIVLAIGNPFGVGQTVTKGIVSALGRGNLQSDPSNNYQDFIQTDAAINPGNSGGALVDTYGRLVGINTMIYSRSGGFQGVGFAVPSNLARNVMERLIRDGKVTRGYIGVLLHPEITSDLADSFNLPDHNGAMIDEVSPDTPADKAGLKNGDVIRELDGKKIADSRQLRLTISEMNPGTKVTLKVLRLDEEKKPSEKSFILTLGELPDQLTENGGRNGPGMGNSPDTDSLDGVEVDDLSADARRQFNIPARVKGALVTSVDEDSNSAKAGLRQGDVILEINHETVHNAQEAVDMSNRAKGRIVLLRIWRDGASTYITVNNRKQQ